MRYFLDHMASIRVLSRLRSYGDVPPSSAIDHVSGEMRGDTDRRAFDYHSLGIDATSVDDIDFLISRRGGGRRLYRTAQLESKVPKGSFIQLDPSTFICSPAMCLVRYAADTSVSLGRLASYAMELLGTYSVHAPSGVPCFNVRPLLTREELLDYLERACAHHLHGARRARTAASFAMERSASTMETCLSLCMTMPPRYGGLGLSQPILNDEVRATAQQRGLIQRDTYHPDIYWPSLRLDVEYDGDQHNTREEILIDRSRQNDLVALGMTILRASFDDVRTSIALASFERKVLTAMKAAGHRHTDRYMRRLDDLDFQADHARLLADLLPPAHDPRL